MSGSLSVPLTLLTIYVSDGFAKTGLAGLALVCVWYAAYRVWATERENVISAHDKSEQLEKILSEREQRRAARAAFGVFLGQGTELMSKCCNEAVPPPREEVEDWANKITVFVLAQLDESYIARMNDGSGMPLGMCTLTSVEHRNVYSAIKRINFRMNQFIGELT